MRGRNSVAVRGVTPLDTRSFLVQGAAPEQPTRDHENDARLSRAGRHGSEYTENPG